MAFIPALSLARLSKVWRARRGLAGSLLLAVLPLVLGGCKPPWNQQGNRQGPGHRPQSLALTPAQEISLGRQAYQEILGKARQEGKLLPQDSPEVQRVRRVGERLKKAVYIEPLQREINYDVKDYTYDWNFNVIRSNQVNAFCLPGAEIVVYTGLLDFVQSDDELAAVLGHEIAHALAHHANERLANERQFINAVNAASGHTLGSLPSSIRDKIIGLLSGGARLYTLKYDRQQESEADHIGIFLMTFAGYNPDAAVFFWQRMEQRSESQPRLPAILSTHPSDRQRLMQIKEWIPYALRALEAYRAGNIAPPP